jgi:hypothetical protein
MLAFIFSSGSARDEIRLMVSSELFEELYAVDICVLKRTFECVTIDLVVEGEHDPSSVRMFHLDVASFAVDLYEAEAPQSREHFPTREQR